MHLANSGVWGFVLAGFIGLTAFIIFSFIIKNRLIDGIFSKGQQELLLSNFNRPLRAVRITALVLALFLIFLSILDPRWGTKSVQANIEGIDIVLVMDISRSMITPDVVPNRLSLSKKLASQLMSLLVGNRIGITAFAGFGFNVIPLSTDINAASVFLNELSTDMIDVQGTNLEDAIKKAMELFEKDALTHKAVVIFTDGEDYEFSPTAQVKAAKDKGITLFTVGIGTPNGGQIPLFDEHSNIIDYLKKDGETVVSKLNEKLLADIAGETKGFYIQGNENSIITLAKRLDEIKKSRFGNNMYEFMEPQYQYFLLMGLLLLLIAVFLPDRKLERAGNNLMKIFIMAFILTLPGINKTFSSEASDGVSEYKKGNYEEALKNFQNAIVKNPKNEKFRFNEGNSFYQLQKTDDAARSYMGLQKSSDHSIKEKALYNLGSTYLDKKDMDGAIQTYREILENGDKNSPLYKKALQNFIFAKQQKKNNQNQQDQNKDNKDNKQNQDKNNQKQNNNMTNQNQKDKQKQQQQTKPISPSEIENLLNLIQEEEKKHLSKKEKEQGIRVYPRNEW